MTPQAFRNLVIFFQGCTVSSLDFRCLSMARRHAGESSIRQHANTQAQAPARRLDTPIPLQAADGASCHTLPSMHQLQVRCPI